ncbi:Membrane protein YdfJ [Paraconexibacter sp. AEG42_29]|uniref:Membrane protein YdfJ n=1 Tax=Paraconexibacter sp. AEG42_29 TaxID=2997339 RepID=A0AAU7AXS1_9ACTN
MYTEAPARPPHGEQPPGLLARVADLAVRRRRAVVAGWIAVLVAVVALGTLAGGTYHVDYATPGSESKAASDTLAASFGGRSDDTVDVVWRAQAGATTPAVQARVDRVLARAEQLPGLTRGAAVADAELAPDGRTGVVRVPLDRLPDSVPVSTGEALAELAHDASGTGLQVAVAGGINGLTTENESASELVGIAVAVLVLLLTFGGMVAAGLPLLTALFGIGVSAMLGGLLAAVLDTPDWAAQVAIMIGLGVGIDYALLILTRYRAATDAGRDAHSAVIEAMTTAGRSVLVAGATVVVSLLGLFLMGLPYLYGVALASSIAVLVVLAASLTLLPALIAFAGPRVDSLRIPGSRRRSVAPVDVDATPAARWARAVQRRPLTAAVLSVVVLLAMTLPVAGMRFGFPDAGNDPSGSTTRTAYDLLAGGFGPGANGPLLAVASVGGEPAGGATKLAALRRELRADPDVAGVGRVVLDARQSTALLVVTPKTSPQDERTKQLIDRLRDGPLASAGLPVDLGGQTAATVDQGEVTAQRLPLFIGAVIGLSFLLLLAAFRAPVIALKAGAMNLLSIGAAYGVVALVAEGGWAGQLVGIDSDLPVPPFIPVMMFAILFGLSMDYEVFLMSRIKEERERSGDAASAVVLGVARTAKVITAAAAIMVAVFAAFALSPEVFLKLIGIGLATAILVDATIVRMILVPAVMALLGERSWWTPRWLDRLVPNVALEAPATAGR